MPISDKIDTDLKVGDRVVVLSSRYPENCFTGTVVSSGPDTGEPSRIVDIRRDDGRCGAGIAGSWTIMEGGLGGYDSVRRIPADNVWDLI